MVIRGIVDKLMAEANLHRSIGKIHGEARSEFYRQTLAIDEMISHSTCLSCLNGLPTHCLPCGHIICGACAGSLGHTLDGGFFLLDECPLSKYHDEWSSCIVSQMPRQARPRILSLDG
ncbi:hypothetical protein ESCO_001433 [Escovopsis weberi]|uniref:RING-type domain-containing protein n=1 Tax=Escovopsis weberi TaxID=150374 RepID=A0A0M8N3A6_ESCWE|nr:hypothetical protein ESCO_001433 [Escovopsis weberi]